MKILQNQKKFIVLTNYVSVYTSIYACTEIAKNLHYGSIGGEEVCGTMWCVINSFRYNFSSNFQTLTADTENRLATNKPELQLPGVE